MTRMKQKLDLFLRLAQDLGSLSTCKRAHCGAIVMPMDFSEILGIGYNGPPRGMPNDGCTGEEGGCGCIHAEANCVAKTRRIGRPCLMISTTLPCRACAGLVANARLVRAVLWINPYRDETGREILTKAGIFVSRVSDLDEDRLESLFRKLRS